MANPLTSPGHPRTMASMLAPPVIGVQRTEFTHQSSPQDLIRCGFYYTPNPPEPAVMPMKPVRPATAAGQALAGAALEQYSEALGNWNNELNLYYAAQMIAAKPTPVDSAREIARRSVMPDGIPNPGFIITHGGRSNLDGLEGFALGFARHYTVLMFEDKSDDLNHRAATFRSLLNHFTATVLGGRSEGGRACVRSALYTSVEPLILLNYPLVSGMETRYDELLSLPESAEVLFITGDCDHLCPLIQLAGIRKRMRATTWFVKVLNGDHHFEFHGDLTMRVSDACGQIAGMWKKRRDFSFTELVIKVDVQNDTV
ncbi:hypothetical protein VTL71DRAFT_12208 [Oculimacula yallundae]|uniref:KANL3/Tex30 alpha/beta hydrolase-like domain-containing protein n=1 Tax=Oculimacula yallundae TaxID=86028 RepID=A0ABR4CSM8_9HELO